MIDKMKSVILGHAVADALGVPVEFRDRSKVDKSPVTDMMGYGTYPYPAGSWSDDTSMSLCTLDSLANGSIDYTDIMDNFIKWLNENEYTPTGQTFDVGRTCRKSIMLYSQTKDIENCGGTTENSNGNGSLMRIHPMTLYLYLRNDLSLDEKLEIIHKTSALTHAHERSKIGCGIYSFVLWELLDNHDKESVLIGLQKAQEYYEKNYEFDKYNRIFENTFILTKREDISSSGYVVSTLEAALWCLLTTNDYKECVLKAVNLGDDTDTVGAVTGGLAGALYGIKAIPQVWLNVLQKRDYIVDMCERAAKIWTATKV